MLFNSYSYEILYEQFHWIYLQGDIKNWLEFNVPFQHKYGYIRDEQGDIKLLLVTVNNRLKFEIKSVHDLSCHAIVSQQQYF